MSIETLSIVIRAYFWLGAILMVVFLGRVVLFGFKHVDIQEMKKGIFSGKKFPVDAAVQEKIDRGGKLYHRIMLCWFLGFILLAIGSAVFRR